MPDGWRDVNLVDITSLIRNGFSCNQDKNGLGSPVTRIETISDGTINYERVGFTNAPIDNSYRLKSGDILFSHINSVKHIGKVAIYDDTYPLYHGMNLMLIRCQKSCVNPLYLYYILSDRRAKAYFENHCKQAINQASLNRKDIGQFQFTLPPLPEQKKIASILSSVDDAIQATQAVIDQTRKVKQGLQQQLLTRGIGHTRFKQTEIGEIPDEWDLTSLANLGPPDRPAIKAGPFGSTLKKSFYVNHGYKVYGQEQVISGDFSIGNYYIDANLFEKLKTCAVHPGDILISLVGTFGKSIVAPHNIEPGIINPRLVRLALEPSLVEPFFIKEWLECSETQKQLKEVAHGGTMGILNAGTFKSLQLPLPPLHEQRHIVNILSYFDETLKAEHAKLQQNFKVKKGLMQDLLTGSVRVKV